jgi:hypothetical protein
LTVSCARLFDILLRQLSQLLRDLEDLFLGHCLLPVELVEKANSGGLRATSSAIRSIAHSLGTNGSDRTAAVRRSRGDVTRSRRQIDFRYQECRLGSFSPPPYSDAKNLSPRIGTFGQTGTLGDLIDRPLPALLSLFHGLQRGIPNVLRARTTPRFG